MQNFQSVRDVVSHLEAVIKEMQVVIDECCETRAQLQAGIDETDKRQTRAEQHRQAMMDALKSIGSTMPVEADNREGVMAYGRAATSVMGVAPTPAGSIPSPY